MHAGYARAVIVLRFRRAVNMVMMAVLVRMVVIVVVIMRMVMVMVMVMMMMARRMAVAMAMRLGFGRLVARRRRAFLGGRPASANRAHYSTSNSLTRISSPPVICT
jgi:hypothetical protein